MEEKNVLNCQTREEFFVWLSANYEKEDECWISVQKGRPLDDKHLWYLDAVEVALCYGWIDNTNKIINGKRYNRFSKRKNTSLWSELNKERVRRLEKLGLMTKAGRAVLPPMGERSFKIDEDIKEALKKARVWSKFKSFPPLYQRIRAYNLHFAKSLGQKEYEKGLSHLLEETKKGQMYGEWNDYGRLLDY